MPDLLNQNLNDVPQWDGCASFEGGQASKPRASMLQPNQSALLQNMDTDIYGHLITRRGIQQIGNALTETIQGLAFYQTPTTEELITAAGGVLRSFNGSIWTLAGGTFNLISANTPAIFVQGVDILYIAQSDSALAHYQNGASGHYPDAAVAEITKVTTTGADASNLSNRHFIIEDENGSVCVWFNVDSSGTDPLIGDRSIPVYISSGDLPTAIATAIFSALDGDAKFTASVDTNDVLITCVAAGARADVVAGNSGLAVSVFTQGSDQNNHPPVGMSSLVWHTDRLVAAGVPGFPDTVYFSQFLDGSVWDRTNWSIRVGAGEGDPITGLVPWTNHNLIVLKQHSIWLVNCDPSQGGSPINFSIQRVHDRIGCLAPRTACQVGTDIFLLTTSGVRTIKNIIASEQQKEVGPALSEPIGDFIERINKSALPACCAFHWNNRYFLAVPLDDATTPNYVLPFNTNSNSWNGYWTQWKPTYFISRIHGGTPKLCFGQSDGTIVDWMDYIPMSQETDLCFKDQGVDIPSMILTRAFVWNEAVSPKTGFNARLEFNQSEADVVATVIRDAGTEETWESFSTDTGSELTLPFILPANLPKDGLLPLAFDLMRYDPYNQLQLKLSTQSGKLALSTIAASAFVETFVIQS